MSYRPSSKPCMKTKRKGDSCKFQSLLWPGGVQSGVEPKNLPLGPLYKNKKNYHGGQCKMLLKILWSPEISLYIFRSCVQYSSKKQHSWSHHQSSYWDGNTFSPADSGWRVYNLHHQQWDPHWIKGGTEIYTRQPCRNLARKSSWKTLDIQKCNPKISEISK